MMMALAITLTASVKDLPVQTINGKECYCYKVEAGEGMLAISKKLGLSINEIEKYNPEIKNGLKLGQQLVFPVSAIGETEAAKNSKQTVSYIAKKGDTVYGISKAFNMELYDFLELNPDAIKGVQVGNTYKVVTDAASARKMGATTLGAQPAAEVKVAEAQMVSAEPTAATKTMSQTATPVYTETGIHVIGTGETLYSIASKYGSTIEELAKLNPNLDKKHYEIGQKLVVPKKKTLVQSR